MEKNNNRGDSIYKNIYDDKIYNREITSRIINWVVFGISIIKKSNSNEYWKE